MISLHFPWWMLALLVGVQFWPVTLAAALVSAAVAVMTRGIPRVIAALISVAFGGVLVIAVALGLSRLREAGRMRAYDKAVHETLGSARVVDGLALPAGTDLEWTGVDRVHLRMAGLPRPTCLLGLDVEWIARSGDGTGWDVQTPKPTVVEGWTCNEVGVHLSPRGRLRGCRLAGGRLWQGWPIPGDTPLDLSKAGEVGIALIESAIPAPEIGRSVPATGGMSFNADGSLDQVHFNEDDPLVVRGVRLWNSVTWVYSPASLGRGRRRRPLAVRGATLPPESREVEVRAADGRVTPRD